MNELEKALADIVSRKVSKRGDAALVARDHVPKSRKEEDLLRTIIFVGLGDPDEGVRSTCAEGLSSLGRPSDFSRMARLAKDESWLVRCSIFSAMAHVAPKRAGKYLRDAVRHDPDPVARRYAAVGIADAGLVEMLPLLEQVAQAETDEWALVGVLDAIFILTEGEDQRLLHFIDETQETVPRLVAVTVLWEGSPEHLLKNRSLVLEVLAKTPRDHPEIEKAIDKIVDFLDRSSEPSQSETIGCQKLSKNS